jgi:hypothetical protein
VRRIEIRDAELEESGAEFVDWGLSYKLGYQRPEPVRVVIARAKYKVPVAEPESKPLPDDAPSSSRTASASPSSQHRCRRCSSVVAC